MAGFTSYDDLVNEITVNGKSYDYFFSKVSSAPEASGVWHSLWKIGGYPGAGADPAGTPGTQYDDAAGAMFFPDQASDQKHLISFGALSTQSVILLLYDRLVGVGGISVASTGNKTINSSALLRYSGAAAKNVQCWLEVTTATTTTAPVVSMNSYTDQDGNTAQAGGSVTFPAAATNVDALIGPMPLATGDLGVRSVETINVATAAAAGVVNVILIRPLAYLYVPTSAAIERDTVLQITSLPRIYDGASLCLAYMASGTTAPTIMGSIRVAYG